MIAVCAASAAMLVFAFGCDALLKLWEAIDREIEMRERNKQRRIERRRRQRQREWARHEG